MPPSKSKDVRFPTWDELVEEARPSGEQPPYQIPFGPDDVVEIERPDGDRYLRIIDAQRRGDAVALMAGLFPDDKVRDKVRAKMKGADFEIVDLLGSKAMRYFYGLNIETEAKTGNSPAS